MIIHYGIIKWKHFPCNWPLVREIHRSPVNSPHKGQWHGALMFSLICTWINSWAADGDAGGLRRHCAHYNVRVMFSSPSGRNISPKVPSISFHDLRLKIRSCDRITVSIILPKVLIGGQYSLRPFRRCLGKWPSTKNDFNRDIVR